MGSYNEEFRKKIVRLHLENGQSLKSLADKYTVSKASISNRVKQYRKECQNNTSAKDKYDFMK
jgi:transposase